MSRSSAKIVIARIGEPLSYSDIAAREMFGRPKIVLCGTFEECFVAVRSKKAKYAVVPVNNKASGDISEVGETLTVKQMARRMKLRRTHTLSLPVCHVIASHGLLEDVRIVYSKKQALDQCTKFCKRHRLETRSYFFGGIQIPSTSAAAKRVAKRRVRSIAAICSPEAARKHGLRILYDGNIADVEDNYTIFYAYALRP